MDAPRLTREGRDNRLDAFRLGLALLVFASHCWGLTLGSNRDDPIDRITRGQVSGGSLAVAAFFAISGFLIAQSWAKSRGVLDFLRRRILRIYPGFLAACLFSVAVAASVGVAPIPGHSAGFPARQVLGAALRLRQPTWPGAYPSNPYPGEINGSLWTISYEFGCYLVVAMLGTALLLRKGPVVALFGASLAAFLAFDVAAEPGEFGPAASWARYFALFFAGSVACLGREAIPRSRALALASGLALVVGSLFPPFLTAMLPIAGVYLLFYLAFAPGAREPARARPDLSYGVYLYAFPVQQAIVAWRPGIRPLTLMAVAIVPILALAAASWYAIERPCLARKRRLPIFLKAGRVGLLGTRARPHDPATRAA
jgi:peptidoglycan/LPS O-acetylase OafA/YrhL